MSVSAHVREDFLNGVGYSGKALAEKYGCSSSNLKIIVAKMESEGYRFTSAKKEGTLEIDYRLVLDSEGEPVMGEPLIRDKRKSPKAKKTVKNTQKVVTLPTTLEEPKPVVFPTLGSHVLVTTLHLEPKSGDVMIGLQNGKTSWLCRIESQA